MKDKIFYEFKGTFGNDIKVFYCTGLQMMKILLEARQDEFKVMQLFMERCVTIDNVKATEDELDKIPASDFMDISDAIGKQISKMKFI